MLNLSQALTYTAALGIAAAIPGPGMAALVARSVSGGTLSGFCLLFGLILGDLTYLSFAIFGLAMVAAHFDALFHLVRCTCAIWLGNSGSPTIRLSKWGTQRRKKNCCRRRYLA